MYTGTTFSELCWLEWNSVWFNFFLSLFSPSLATVLIQWTTFNLGRLWTTGSLWRGWQRWIFSIQFMRCIALLNRRRRAVSCSFMSVQGHFKAPRVHTFHLEGRRCTKTPISENKTLSNKYVARSRAQKMNKYHMMYPIYFFIFKQSECRTGWWTDFFPATASCYVIN